MIERTEADADQRAHYLEAAVLTQAGLADAIALLDARSVAADLTTDERKSIKLKRAELVLKATKAHDELLAFLADDLAITPPSSEQVEVIRQHAEELDKMLANAVTAKTVLTVTRKLLTEFNKTTKA